MENKSYGQHISQQYNEELEDVRNRVLAMGGLVEQQLADAVTALVDGDVELGEQVITLDYQVNAFEVSIDEECSRILARRQPAASDLRLVVAVIKTITDLERIGDQAERVGRMSLRLAQGDAGRAHYSEIKHLGDHVRQMLHDALDALARMDPEAAVKVAREDIKVDKEYESLMRQLITYMMEDPRTITRVLDIMWSARALERVGDHARNICEYIIYLVMGKDVRHTSLERMEQEARGKR
ncbi:phosphate signaling complex protein PhoU [Thiohalomonas denitrificans]|uniref:Phosphate-specific transport system accessory protein PhoU n=1 Tax=Thiohalomonas denitrificans TaxID=415747 RepID=A0A1G5Q6I7_9GAMM|nr:phosphate signaling complex protein PhoU [Thiohalomonas denitrificans]SCZ57228.1 phosphate transport system protein [Thiohalomonas denitrificans]